METLARAVYGSERGFCAWSARRPVETLEVAKTRGTVVGSAGAERPLRSMRPRPPACLRVVRGVSRCIMESSRVSAPRPGSPRASWLWVGVLIFGGGLACPAEEGPPRSATREPPPSDRFLRIRRLLAQPPQSPERAEHLYPSTEPLCAKGPERDAFFETAKWSVDHSEGDDQLTTVLAVDVFEFVATACARTSVEGALSFLDRARATVPQDPQIDVVTARIAAAADRFELASRAAQRAIEGGSNHAIALLANIQARLARNRVGPGFEPGMFDEAIETASVEPDGDWQAIDLTAVLSTRARLYIERALWLPPEEREASLEAARSAFTRLSKSPFVESVRRSALDHLCFDTPTSAASKEACVRAAEEFGMIGAAAVIERSLESLPKADPERAEGLRRFVERVGGLGPKASVVVVFRGDESEIVEWGRPAASVLRGLRGRDPRVVVVDRTSTARGSALVDRVLELSGIRPSLRIATRADALATSCLAALVAGREAPETCPLPPEEQSELAKLPDVELVLLVGRDLDAEIDDFGLYDLPTHLFSFRRTNAKKAPEGWFKSLCDVWYVLQPERAGGPGRPVP